MLKYTQKMYRAASVRSASFFIYPGIEKPTLPATFLITFDIMENIKEICKIKTILYSIISIEPVKHKTIVINNVC